MNNSGNMVLHYGPGLSGPTFARAEWAGATSMWSNPQRDGTIMGEQHVIHAAMQGIGSVLMLCLLADIFLTVLYARMGTTLLSGYVGRTVWRIFRLVAMQFPRHRGTILSFCGPAMLLILVGFWAIGLTVGAALIFYPRWERGFNPAAASRSRATSSPRCMPQPTVCRLSALAVIPQRPAP